MFGLVPFKFNNGENSRGLTINDMFNDFFSDDMLSEFKSGGSFKTDIKETPEEYIVHAELPGVKKEDINIDYNNNYLTILLLEIMIMKKRKIITLDVKEVMDQFLEDSILLMLIRIQLKLNLIMVF